MNPCCDAPLLSILDRFTSPNVPARGSDEESTAKPEWPVCTEGTPKDYPGEGMARYPMLYIGEGYNRMFLIQDGKVIWTYDTGLGNEYDDIWMLKNGNILFSRMRWVGEVTPEKKLVWRYDAVYKKEEMHTIQPIGKDRALIMVNAEQPYCMLINRKTGDVEYRHDVSYTFNGRIHGQFRRFRMTGSGTFLAPFLGMDKVVEYDRDFNELWRYDVRRPWAAVRLNNGNTLITNEESRETIEVSPEKEILWRYGLDDMPEQ